MRDTLLIIRYSDGSPDSATILTADYHKEGGQWLAECLETGTAAYAPTLEEARAQIEDAVTPQLTEMEKL